jgi:hypothetical protein
MWKMWCRGGVRNEETLSTITPTSRGGCPWVTQTTGACSWSSSLQYEFHFTAFDGYCWFLSEVTIRKCIFGFSWVSIYLFTYLHSLFCVGFFLDEMIWNFDIYFLKKYLILLSDLILLVVVVLSLILCVGKNDFKGLKAIWNNYTTR